MEKDKIGDRLLGENLNEVEWWADIINTLCTIFKR